jgi:hypothetical protein
VILWYGLVPIAGAFASRHIWRVFRGRFDDLRLQPFLDYAVYRQSGNENGVYRFIGEVESVTDGHTLWIRGENLTIPVALAGAQIYVLPMPESGGVPEVFDPGEGAPERIRWDQVSTLTGGSKVFAGGALVLQENRRIFVSTREHPLLVIFYDGPDRSLTPRTIRAGRGRNEYWNVITPYAFILGVFSQLVIILSFLSRLWFRQTVIAAFVAIFTPLFPVIPPGILCTVVYRRLWWRARLLRAYRDLVRLPLKYFPPGENICRLPDGELYGVRRYDTLPGENLAQKIPLLIPPDGTRKKEGWYIYGALPGKQSGGNADNGTAAAVSGAETAEGEIFPQEPRDVFAPYGAVPGNPEVLARRYTQRAYILEIISWLILLAGVALNIFFFSLIIFLLFYQPLSGG